MAGICILGIGGFNIAMQFPNNEVLICVSLVILGGAGMACLPLTNELIVETTYPAGEATSTGIGSWLSGPLSGVLVALSSLIPYSDQNEYPDTVCREGELQDLSWFFSIMNSVLIAYYLFFVYSYRKFDQFLSISKIYNAMISDLNIILILIVNEVVPICDKKQH